jgi:hypothetical protein
MLGLMNEVPFGRLLALIWDQRSSLGYLKLMKLLLHNSRYLDFLRYIYQMVIGMQSIHNNIKTQIT